MLRARQLVGGDAGRRIARLAPDFNRMPGRLKYLAGSEIGAGVFTADTLPEQKVDWITTKLSFPAAFNESLRQNSKGALLIVQFLKGMVERRMSPKNLSGPIGIGVMAGDAARAGPSEFFMLMSMVSLNLAIFNLLPIPILDGGVILMLLVEMAMQRDLSINVKEAVFKVGFVCIMVIVVFALYNDISKILPAG